jgi:hypothetical protein
VGFGGLLSVAAGFNPPLRNGAQKIIAFVAICLAQKYNALVNG